MYHSLHYLAVVFDLDGVLIDSEPIHLKSADIVLRRHGIVLTPEQAFQQTGITIQKFFERLVKEWGFPGPKPGEDWVAEKRAVFREIAERELQPVAGADAFIRSLHGRVKIGLASSSPLRYCQWTTARFGWQPLFDAWCTIEDVREPKPDPQMYRLIVQRLGVARAHVLVFEDSPAGVEAAVRAGLDCVGVGTSYPREALCALGAKGYVRDFTEAETLRAFLNGSGKSFKGG